MRIVTLHRWDLAPPEARALQARLARCVRARTPPRFAPRLVAAADMSHRRGSEWLYGAVVVVEWPALVPIETASARRRADFPYVPGLLSFREGPVLLDCFRKLRARPDAVLFDAHGLAHPRRFGLACHLGLWLDLPSAGCAKSRLCGEYAEPGAEPGSRAPLLLDGARVGSVLRSRRGSRPLFVSAGHRLALADAEALVWQCLRGARQPEPSRLAHLAVNDLRRNEEGGG